MREILCENCDALKPLMEGEPDNQSGYLFQDLLCADCRFICATVRTKPSAAALNSTASHEPLSPSTFARRN
jgi:hypothetical protein